MTEREVAEASGTPEQIVSSFLNAEGDRSPTLETIVKLAYALGRRVAIRLVDRTGRGSLAAIRCHERTGDA